MDAISKRAVELCKQFPRTPTRTLARRLSKEFGTDVTFEKARDRIRYARGTKGQARRKNAKAKHLPAPAMPVSKAEDWKPHKLPAGRIAIISDLHVPFHDQVSIDSTLSFLRKSKIDCLLINGDYGDWYSISRWLKDPRKRDLKLEIQNQKEGLRYFRQVLKKANFVYKNGNHEDRWEHFIWNHAPEICEMENIQLPAILEFENLGIEHIKEERPILVGDLSIFHGHEIPGGGGQNPAKSAFTKLGTECLVGHSHRSSFYIERDYKRQEKFSYSIGCLCDLSPQYARINKWNHGFAIVETTTRGQFHVENYWILDGKVSKR